MKAKNVKTVGYRKKGYKKNYKPKTTGKATVKTIKSIVKNEIARNVENKITPVNQISGSILTIEADASGNGSLQYLVNSPVQTGFLNIIQGTSQSQRIGNQIKLKRWVVKGTVYFDLANGQLGDPIVSVPFKQNQGYVNLYFGRLLNMDNQINTGLTDLFQNGNDALSPSGLIVDRLYTINKDVYKIYWHKQYKIGISSPTNPGPTAGVLNNNDYMLNEEFGFDICKLCTKNKVIKYDDDNAQPNDALLNSLTLFATYTNPNADINLSSLTPSTTFYSPVRLEALTYAEYEDA